MPAPDGNGDEERDDNPEPLERAMTFLNLQPKVDDGFWLLSHKGSHSTPANMSKKIPKYQSMNDPMDPYEYFNCRVLLLWVPEASLAGRLEI